MKLSKRRRTDLRVLRQREFRLFLTGRVASRLGSTIAPIAISFAILEHHGTASQVGTVLAAQSVPLVIFLLIGGGLADRWGRRRAMVAADVLRAVAQGALASWLLLGRPPLWAFALAEAVVGFGMALFGPATTGLVPELVTNQEQLQQANSLHGLTTSLSAVVGPAIAGLIVAATNPGIAVAVDAATYLLSGLLLGALHIPAKPSAPAISFFSQLRGGWTAFRTRTWLWLIVLQYAVFHLVVLAPFTVLGVVVAKTSLGGAPAWGTILAALGLGSVVGSVVVLHMRPRRPLLVATSTGAAWVAPLFLLGVSAPLWAIGFGAFLAGCAFGIFGPLWDTTLQREIPPNVLSSVSSYDYLGSVALLPLGYAIAGPLSGVIGIKPLLLLAGIWMLVSSLAVLAVPVVRRLEARD